MLVGLLELLHYVNRLTPSEGISDFAQPQLLATLTLDVNRLLTNSVTLQINITRV